MNRKRKSSTAHGEDSASPSLSKLCADAADHVARARLSLYADDADGEEALAQLDEAILCLRQLLAHGRRSMAKDASHTLA